MQAPHAKQKRNLQNVQRFPSTTFSATSRLLEKTYQVSRKHAVVSKCVAHHQTRSRQEIWETPTTGDWNKPRSHTVTSTTGPNNYRHTTQRSAQQQQQQQQQRTGRVRWRRGQWSGKHTTQGPLHLPRAYNKHWRSSGSLEDSQTHCSIWPSWSCLHTRSKSHHGRI